MPAGNLRDHAEKQAEGLPLRIQDIAGIPVTITGVRFNTGQFGPYAVMTVVKDGGETFDVMTSAMLVLDALEHASVAEAFPVEATFSLKGKTWVID